MSPKGLELRDGRVRYATPGGPVDALAGLDCAFEPAQSTAVVGRSGAGKSTLVAVLGLMRSLTSGQVLWDGAPVPSSRSGRAAFRARHIGMIFQSFHLDPQASAMENILLPWHFRPDLSRQDAQARAHAALDRLGIADLEKRRVHSMSGGQRQRVAIARALAGRPSVLIADEPTGNLDETTGMKVAGDLFALTDEGMTVIVVTHDVGVAGLADRELRLSRGRLLTAEG